MAGGDKAAIRVQVLGLVRAWHGDQELDLGPEQRRRLLAALALDPGEAVSHALLERAVWPDQLPANPPSALQRLAHGLRGVLEPSRGARQPGQVVVTSLRSYELRVASSQVDAWVFRERREAARRARANGDLVAAVGLLDQALGSWRGGALTGFAGVWAEGVRAGLGEEWRAAVADRIEVRLELGGHGEVVAELAGLAGDHPGDPRFHRLYMLALYRCGRVEEALDAYQHARRLWVDGALATDPPAELRALQQQILTNDPALDPPRQSGPPVQQVRSAVVPWELPPDVKAFTGRDGELAELDQLLDTAGQPSGGGSPRAGLGQAVRPSGGGSPRGGSGRAVLVCAVSGTAGVGKTALVVRWAHRAQACFPDGVLYADLHGYDPGPPLLPDEVLAGFLRALGASGQDIPPGLPERTNRYRTLTRDRRMLVVLDNAASAEQVRPLLPGTSSVMVVVTSRDSLAGLAARDGAHRLDLDLLPAADAQALLQALIGDRAAIDPGAVAELARLCAWLPLALRVAAEVAAVRPGLPLDALVAELGEEGRRLELLDAGGDVWSAVASVFSWSYGRLDDEAARMFRLLGLHPGQDWDQHTAAALTGASVARAARVLNTLARAHLIQPAGVGRYGLHDLLRDYAASLAHRHDDEQDRRASRTRLFDYYLVGCAAALDIFLPGERHDRPAMPPAGTPAPGLDGPAAARAWLDGELATVTAVAGYAAGHGWPGHATGLAALLSRYLLDGGHYPQAQVIHGHALQAARSSGDQAAEARALRSLGALFERQDLYEQALGYQQQALKLARAISDQGEQARALSSLGVTYGFQRRYRSAAARFRQARALFSELGDLAGEAGALGNLGLIERWQARYQHAAGYLEQSLALARRIGHPYIENTALYNLGMTCYWLGRYDQAEDHQQQALALARQSGALSSEANALLALGLISHRQGRYQPALEHHEQALVIFDDLGDRLAEAGALTSLAETLLATGQPSRARDHHTTALTVARQLSEPRIQATALEGLGRISHQHGDYQQAANHHYQALTLYQGDLAGSSRHPGALNSAGQTLLAIGQSGSAHDCHTAALSQARRSGDRYQQARALHGLAAIGQAAGQPAQARRHWQRARGIYTSLGVPEAHDHPAAAGQLPNAS